MSPTETIRRLGPLTATALVIASMIGTGVFTTSGLLLADLGSPTAVLVAWAVGGIAALAGALCYGELAAALPDNGGEYHFLREAYHPALGFASGVVSFVVGFAAPIAASALAFGEYLERVFPQVSPQVAAVALILAMCGVHCARVRVGGRVQNALTLFKVFLIVGVIAVGLAHSDPSRLFASDRPLLEATVSSEMAVALIFVTFAYSGWNAATYLAGEITSPGKVLPLSLVLGTLTVTLLYLLLNAVFLSAAPAELLEGQVAVAHVAFEHAVGADAADALSVIVAFGLVSTVGALIMTGTRVLDTMGQHHGPLALVARRATAGGSPWVAVCLQGAVALALVLSASFTTLLLYIGFTLSLFAALTVLGVILLRRRRPDLQRPYRTWGYPFTPVLFVALMVWMIGWSISERPVVAIFGAVTVGASLLLWWLLERRGAPPRANGRAAPRQR